MIVIADTSPLNYLVQVGSDWLLPSLYQRVLIPTAVLNELRDVRAPQAIAAWAGSLPAWVEVRQISIPPDIDSEELGTGESEAIALAMQFGAKLLLMDDRKARIAAEQRGVPTTGVLGVLLQAQRKHLADAEEIYQRLTSETNFRVTRRIHDAFLTAVRDAKSPEGLSK